MTIVSEKLVDDSFKVINKVTGARSENEKLIELDNLKGSTNESEISIANAYYEVEGTGKVTLQFDNDKKLDGVMRKKLSLTLANSYGWKSKMNFSKVINEIIEDFKNSYR